MASNKIEKKDVDLSKMAYLLITMISVVVICVYAEEYLVTFIVALIVWFIIHELRENIQQVPFMRKHFPMWLQSTIGFIVICVVIYIVIKLLLFSTSKLTANIAEYESNLDIVLFKLSALVGTDVKATLTDYMQKIDFSGIVSSAAGVLSTLFGDAFLVLIYVLFLLIEESIFPYKLEKLYKNDEKIGKTQKLFQKMDKNISRYLTLKTIVSLLTGVLSYIAFLIFGLDGAIFWALLIFVLNYIPTIGSLIATVFPAVFAIVQFGEFAPFFYILAVVGVIQVVVGNILEPKIMGNSLNISSLVVILSLTVWGAIWGIMGMILSVPITVMMIIVFEEIPSLRFIAVLLSEKGDLIEEEVQTSS